MISGLNLKFRQSRFWLALAMAVELGFFTSAAGADTNDIPVTGIKLNDYLQQVMEHNESVQAQMLETEVARHKNKAEAGIFEPEFQASYTRESNQRTNNVQQQAQQNGEGYFSERNNIYDFGVQDTIPTGGKIRLGYTLSDLANNVNPNASFLTSTNSYWSKQYQTFVGVTFTQPILKDGWLTPTLANLRLSAMESDIAFQEYRQQLMVTIFHAENAYWNLFFSQEQVQFFDQSVADTLAVSVAKIHSLFQIPGFQALLQLNKFPANLIHFHSQRLHGNLCQNQNPPVFLGQIGGA